MSKDDTVAPNESALKKKRTRLLLGGVVVAVAGLAIAASAGKYYCPECTFNEPAAFGDTEMYIRSEVNQHVNSWVDSKGNPLDVTICNGTQCATFLYVKLSSVWLLKKLENSNWKGSGGGGGGGGMEGGGPGGGFGGDECSVVPKTGSACVGVNGVNHCQTIDSSYIDCGFGA